jgi:biotin carboxyl carrier protein
MSDYITKVNSKKYQVVINKNHVKVNDSVYECELTKANSAVYLLRVGNKIYDITVNELGSDRYGILIEGEYFETEVKTKLREQAEEYLKNKADISNKGVLKAPMPGLVIKVNVGEGDEVKSGDILIVLEAMKMENNIKSVHSGTVKEIRFKQGDSVEKDDVIMTIE